VLYFNLNDNNIVSNNNGNNSNNYDKTDRR
jgi:hypothetical protein